MALSRAKQWTKQKLGAAEPSKEEPEFERLFRVFEEDRQTLKVYLDEFKKLLKTSKKALTLNERIHTSTVKLSSNDEKVDMERQQRVNQFLRFDQAWNTHQQHVNDSLSQLIIEPLEQLLACEVKDTIEAKGVYDTAHLDLDAHVDRANNATSEKKEAADQALQRVREHYEKSKIEVREHLETVIKKKNMILADNLNQFAEIRAQNLNFQEPEQTGSQFGSNVRESEHMGTKFGSNVRESEHMGSKFGSNVRESEQTGSKFGSNVQEPEQVGARYNPNLQRPEQGITK